MIGKGYKYGFYGILFYNAFYAAAGSWLGSSLFEPGPAAFMNICIGLIIFAAYCIWNDAYFALNYRSSRYIVLLIVLAVINYGAGIGFLLVGVPMIENGLLTTSATNFMCAVLLTIILLLLLIRKLVPVKGEEEEEDLDEDEMENEMPRENTPNSGNSNDKDLSQQALADLVGVSRQTINAIEKGDYNPTIKLCIAICKVLDKTLNELFWEE